MSYKTHAVKGLTAYIAGNRKECPKFGKLSGGREQTGPTALGETACKQKFSDQAVTLDLSLVDCLNCLNKIATAKETAKKNGVVNEYTTPAPEPKEVPADNLVFPHDPGTTVPASEYMSRLSEQKLLYPALFKDELIAWSEKLQRTIDAVGNAREDAIAVKRGVDKAIEQRRMAE